VEFQEETESIEAIVNISKSLKPTFTKKQRLPMEIGRAVVPINDDRNNANFSASEPPQHHLWLRVATRILEALRTRFIQPAKNGYYFDLAFS